MLVCFACTFVVTIKNVTCYSLSACLSTDLCTYKYYPSTARVEQKWSRDKQSYMPIWCILNRNKSNEAFIIILSLLTCYGF